jgi:HlyD family secretion protein
LGDTAIVEVDAYSNRKFKGLVYKIANPTSSSALTGGSSTTEVTNYKVHIRLLPDSYSDLVIKGKSFPFRPGMTASADIQTKSHNNVLSVPLNAVTTRDPKDSSNTSKNDKKEKKDENVKSDAPKSVTAGDNLQEVVFVLQKDNKVKQVKVKTAIQDLNNIEIVEGLKEGDEDVTGPYSTVSKTLKEGTLVKKTAKDKLFEEKKKD